MNIYRLNDASDAFKAAICVKDLDEAKFWNDKGWGIFFTPNRFKTTQRRVENLDCINSWYIDIDNCDKEKKLKFIMNSPLLPSVINETKRGLHVFFKSIDATLANFTEIEERLIEYYDADKAVKDVSRLLRLPNFYHCKDLNNKFLVKTIFELDISYSEPAMMCFFNRKVEKQSSKHLDRIADFKCVNLTRLLKPETINTGERNHKLFRKGVFLKRLGANQQEVDEILHWLNQSILNPIKERELNLIIRSYSKWKT